MSSKASYRVRVRVKVKVNPNEECQAKQVRVRVRLTLTKSVKQSKWLEPTIKNVCTLNELNITK